MSNNRRRLNGEETWYRLREWTKGQAPAERLAGNILQSEGFVSIDPSHPLGGPDGIKDLKCIKDEIPWIVGCYFPRGQKSFNTIKEKFLNDLEGIHINSAQGIVFITNQELSLAERDKISDLTDYHTEIYHLERLASLLNNPINYGIRLEFLDIEMTPEEQLSYFAERDKDYQNITNKIENFMSDMDNFKNVILNRPFLDEARSEEEISEAVEEFLEKVWYNRHLVLRYKVEKGIEKVHPEIWKGALSSAKRVEEKYGLENLDPYDDFEWGMINGKLSALRWVLGDDWDMLDT